MASIRPSLHFAQQSLAARPSRTALVAVAVMLAATLVSATGSGIATAFANVDARMRRAIGSADARVVHRHGAGIDESAIAEAASWPGVRAAAGRLVGSLTLCPAGIDRADPASRARRVTVQCRGTDPESDAIFDQVEYVDGRAPANRQEIGLDPLAAQKLRVAVGDEVDIVRFGEPMRLRVSGIRQRMMLGALQRPTAHLSRVTLAEASSAEGEVTVVSIALDAGIDTNDWVKANASRVEAPLMLEPAELATSGLGRQASAADLGLVLATALSFLSCACIVGIAMTTAVGEQQRAFAMARCVGASRGQIFSGQLMGGAILCGSAGLVGAPLGIAVAGAIAWWYRALLTDGLTVSWTAAALSVVGATLAGVLGALWPAWQASRVSVLRALSPRAHAPDPRGTWLIGAVGLALIAFQVALLAVDGAERRFYAYSFIGLPALQVGWFLLAVPVLALVARVACRPIERLLALPRGVLAGSSQAHPYRFGLVAGALMVGVGILVSTWTNGRALLDEISERVRFGDAFAFKTTGFSAEETARLRALDGPTASAAIGYMPLQVLGTQVFGLTGLSPTSVVCIGFEPRPFLAMNRLEWIAGDPEHATRRLLDGDAVLVAQEFLVARGLGVGSTITIGSASHSVPVEIVGVVGAAGLDVATQFFGIRSLYSEHAVSCIFMDFDAVARHFGSRESYIVQMQLPDSVSDDAEAALAASVEDAVPGAVFASGRQIRREISRIGHIMLGVSSGVACGALGLACIAASSVIAAGVAGRAQEFGVIQAVGGSRAVVVRMVCGEALLIGITASAVGAGFGMHLAWMGTRMYRELGGLELVYAVQPDIIALGAAVVIAAAIAASWPAGRRTASRPIRELLASAKA